MMNVVSSSQADASVSTTISTVVAGRFQNKIAIVTGAESRIDLAVVVRLVAEGAAILGLDVNEAGLKETVQLTSHFERVSIAVVSVTNEQQIIEKVDESVIRQGHLDVLVNMAGILRITLSAATTLKQFRSVIDTNLTGTFLMCRICLPHLLITKSNIVNAASTEGLFAHPYMAAYAASKGAIMALTKSLAREYMLQRVRANAVVPGGIATPIRTSFRFPSGANSSLLNNVRMPDNPFGQPKDVVGMVAMLAFQYGSFINGEVIRIDGGIHS